MANDPGRKEHAGFTPSKAEGTIDFTLRVTHHGEKLWIPRQHFSQILRPAWRDNDDFRPPGSDRIQLIFHLPEVCLTEDSHEMSIKDQHDRTRSQL